MICYKGKSFCCLAATNVCINTDCDRYLHHKQDTGGLPVSLAEFRTDDCGYIENPIINQLNVITSG